MLLCRLGRGLLLGDWGFRWLAFFCDGNGMCIIYDRQWVEFGLGVDSYWGL